jgi:acyl carrier protein
MGEIMSSNNSDLDIQNIELGVRKIIAKIIEKPESSILPDAHLVEELGADSMMILEIMVALDKKFGIDISEDRIPSMTTLTQIKQLVVELLKK